MPTYKPKPAVAALQATNSVEAPSPIPTTTLELNAEKPPRRSPQQPAQTNVSFLGGPAHCGSGRTPAAWQCNREPGSGGGEPTHQLRNPPQHTPAGSNLRCWALSQRTVAMLRDFGKVSPPPTVEGKHSQLRRLQSNSGAHTGRRLLELIPGDAPTQHP